MRRMTLKMMAAAVLAVLGLFVAACTGTSTSNDAASTGQEDGLAGLTECAALYTSGDVPLTPSPFSQFSAIRQDIIQLVDGLPANTITGYGSGQSVYGRLTVMLSTRDAAVLRQIQAIDESHGQQADICVEVPPIGYYDEPLRTAPWQVADLSLPVEQHWQALTLSVGHDCGGSLRPLIRAPQVVYTDTEVQISVELDHPLWGAETTECRPPATVLIELSEDPAGRPLVNPNQQAPAAAGTPAPPPTPAPPLPHDVAIGDPIATQMLQRVLLEAGFEHIVGDAPESSSWSASGGWNSDRFDFTLSQAELPTDVRTGSQVLNCGLGILVLPGDLPVAARNAVSAAAGCNLSLREDMTLTLAYEQCVRDAGISPFEAQVFVGTNDELAFVKTAPVVPPTIHNPCWQSIGGLPPGLSSPSLAPTPTPTPG